MGRNMALHNILGRNMAVSAACWPPFMMANLDESNEK